MINDRLGALKAIRNEENYEDGDEVTISIEETESFMPDFFSNIEEVTQSLDKISATIDEVKKKHSAILSAPSTNEKVKQELEDLMAENKRLLNKVKQKLKAIGQDLEHQEQGNNTSVTFRIQKTQHSALSRRFVDVLSVYNTIQIEYRQRCKDRIKRQLEITGHLKSDDEIEEMLESGDPQVFTQGIVIETQKAKQTLADIEDRHADIIKLEKSISELHDMFMDMAVMIESQGELIDRIEYNVQNTTDYVGVAKKELHAAKTWQSKARKKVIILSIVAIIVLIILGLIIGYSV